MRLQEHRQEEPIVGCWRNLEGADDEADWRWPASYSKDRERQHSIDRLKLCK